MLNPEPIDFSPLIKALQSAQGKATFGEQRLDIELAIVASEMNPEPDNFCDLLWAIEAIGEINFSVRTWKPAEQAEEFFK